MLYSCSSSAVGSAVVENAEEDPPKSLVNVSVPTWWKQSSWWMRLESLLGTDTSSVRYSQLY